MDITPKKRASIIALKEHAGLSIRQISKKMKVAKSTVGDILKRKKDTGNLQHCDKEDVEENARQHLAMIQLSSEKV